MRSLCARVLVLCFAVSGMARGGAFDPGAPYSGGTTAGVALAYPAIVAIGNVFTNGIPVFVDRTGTRVMCQNPTNLTLSGSIISTTVVVNVTSTTVNSAYAALAGVAVTAGYASTAGVSAVSLSSFASNATYAIEAGHSTNADTAVESSHATNADFATHAVLADYAVIATSTGVQYSGTAGFATNALYAINATFAAGAGMASNAVPGSALAGIGAAATNHTDSATNALFIALTNLGISASQATNLVQALLGSTLPTSTVARATAATMLEVAGGCSWTEQRVDGPYQVTVTNSTDVYVSGTNGDGYNGPPPGTVWANPVSDGFGNRNWYNSGPWSLAEYPDEGTLGGVFWQVGWFAGGWTFNGMAANQLPVASSYTFDGGAGSLTIDYVPITNATRIATAIMLVDHDVDPNAHSNLFAARPTFAAVTDVVTAAVSPYTNGAALGLSALQPGATNGNTSICKSNVSTFARADALAGYLPLNGSTNLLAPLGLYPYGAGGAYWTLQSVFSAPRAIDFAKRLSNGFALYHIYANDTGQDETLLYTDSDVSGNPGCPTGAASTGALAVVSNAVLSVWSNATVAAGTVWLDWNKSASWVIAPTNAAYSINATNTPWASAPRSMQLMLTTPTTIAPTITWPSNLIWSAQLDVTSNRVYGIVLLWDGGAYVAIPLYSR
jgi:hypothetical protein